MAVWNSTNRRAQMMFGLWHFSVSDLDKAVICLGQSGARIRSEVAQPVGATRHDEEVNVA